MQTFCTIITSDFIPLAKVLFHSLQKQSSGAHLQVLVVDKNVDAVEKGITFQSIGAVADSTLGRSIVKKYGQTNSDQFRWALKPVFINYLLQSGFKKVIQVDPDIYFVNGFDFLFKKLDKADILLSPHWSDIHPSLNESGLFQVLKDGLFNGGFIAANDKAINALTWWAEACNFKMEKNFQLGLYDDQKYLDILPVYFDKVGILKHKGCNLASWNIDTCKREMIDGKLMINREFEPVFIHFAKETIANIINHNDQHLVPYLEEYSMLLKEENFDLKESFSDLDFLKMNSRMAQLKYALRIRTRFKRFLYNLSQKI